MNNGQSQPDFKGGKYIMLYYNMICKQKKQEKKNVASVLERQFVMPVSDKKTFTVTGVFRKDV